MRIAHVVNEPFSPEGASGVQQVIYCLARAQAADRHAVAVFSRDDAAVHVVGHDLELRGGTPMTPASSPRDWLLAWTPDRRMVADVLAWRPDIVHFHSVHIPRIVAVAAWLVRARIPYCITPHGGLFPDARRRGRARKAIFGLVFERRYLERARFIHALSAREVDVVRELMPNQVVIAVPNGVPLCVPFDSSRPDALYEQHPQLLGRRIFMFLGRLDPWQKGLDLLIEAFADAAPRNSALVLVGPDFRGSRTALARRAERRGTDAPIVFTGPAYGPDRANLLAAADVFVHPSRWEGLSLSVLVAAAAGKPCVITHEADPDGQLARAHAAIMVEPTVSSLAAGLEHAASLSDESLAIIGARARGVADAQFSWSTIAGRLTDAYQDAIEVARTDSDAPEMRAGARSTSRQ